MNMMKRALIIVTAGLAFASAGAIAQNTASEQAQPLASKAVKLSDAQLDEITAGAALVGTVVMNPGQASVFRLSDNRALCINCTEFGVPGIDRFIVVQTPSHLVFHCAGVGCP